MCRAIGERGGPRRCPNCYSPAKARYRQRLSRARRALRAAQAGGDHAAIAAAQAKFATVESQVATAPTVSPTSKTSKAARPATAPAAAQQSTAPESPARNAAPAVVPTALPSLAMVSGRMSDQPVLENGWGADPGAPIHFHDDGPIGTALAGMGPDARMDVDGAPLANVLGRIATDVVQGRRTAQQGVQAYSQIRDRLPESSRARNCLSWEIDKIDAPLSAPPALPANTPAPLAELAARLHAVPMVRRDPAKELEPLMTVINGALEGRLIGTRMAREVQRIANRRHESLGDSGKFEIDQAVADTVETLRKLPL
jgi:hypothetical protein